MQIWTSLVPFWMSEIYSGPESGQKIDEIQHELLKLDGLVMESWLHNKITNVFEILKKIRSKSTNCI